MCETTQHAVGTGREASLNEFAFFARGVDGPVIDVQAEVVSSPLGQIQGPRVGHALRAPTIEVENVARIPEPPRLQAQPTVSPAAPIEPKSEAVVSKPEVERATTTLERIKQLSAEPRVDRAIRQHVRLRSNSVLQEVVTELLQISADEAPHYDSVERAQKKAWQNQVLAELSPLVLGRRLSLDMVSANKGSILNEFKRELVETFGDALKEMLRLKKVPAFLAS